MEKVCEKAIFNIERDRLMSWFLKQKDRLTASSPDIPEEMVHKRILRKCGSDLENAIRSRCIEPFSTEDYINSMEDITTRTQIGRNWFADTYPKKTRIQDIEIEKTEDAKETNDLSLYYSDSEASEEEELQDQLNIENINVSFEVTEVHTHLTQYND
ncbi:hypothetical protein O181_011653 [Austropuccinia psidii MF-1]|uniref:Uncharacterized protein n=1 Tax=Austropuccinia psidii MF-1 TaxID=1389203 RepID=A0A9Q3GLH0_9BASI|nr:hypothetical protein [Austropuccinia psidii MF-1]